MSIDHQKILPLLVLTASITACGPNAVNLQPAPDATNPACAKAMVAMPKTLSGLDQRETTAQATTAWGEPTAIVLKCGVELPTAPVSDPCQSVNGVDWIVKPTDKEQAQSSEQTATGTWYAETFGREPAIQVTFEADRVSSSTVLAELASAVEQLPQKKQCTNVEDTLTDVQGGVG
ncbi:DUF3515 domain-containing protein [Rothia sp. P5764]|uniref:DUF3515 domain-containing protein n=1 Tax=Rothia sp. P5764 TaxID=3402654 RepID=UPI003ABF9F6A